MTRFGVAVVVCIAIASSGYLTEGKPRIIDGVQAHIDEYPFLGLISPKQRVSWADLPSIHVHCGSALIHPKFAITAYHCFSDGNNGTDYVIYFSVQNRCRRPSSPPNEISEIFSKPGAHVGNTVKHDIVVVKLAKPQLVPFYAQLPKEKLTVNQIGTVVGFGLVKIVGKGNAKDLTCTIQQMNEFVLPLSRCGFIEGWIIGAFCAYNPLRHIATACRGDSGGPWLAKDAFGNSIVYGISSFGDENCNQEDLHDAYTNVYFYNNWITGIVKNHS